jgi:hypothetical protein
MAKRNSKLVKGEMAESKFKTKFDERGRRLMRCQNSEPGGKWWKGELCDSWSAVGNDATAVLCSRCVQKHVEPPIQRGAAPKSDRPRGWKFIKEFVMADGTVYHKGIEQPALKGTLPATKIEPKPEKKKISKEEKQANIHALGIEIKGLKALLVTEQRKGKRAEAARKLSKANRELKKLM